jgi:hypothetical protein
MDEYSRVFHIVPVSPERGTHRSTGVRSVPVRSFYEGMYPPAVQTVSSQAPTDDDTVALPGSLPGTGHPPQNTE